MHCVKSGASLLGNPLVSQTTICKSPVVFRHSKSAQRAANLGMDFLMSLAVGTSYVHSHVTDVRNGLTQTPIAEV